MDFIYLFFFFIPGPSSEELYHIKTRYLTFTIMSKKKKKNVCVNITFMSNDLFAILKSVLKSVFS